ncbi:hypothetical protein OAF63_00935 [Saprospiraceae bacterium]|jgi:hypothetical protein|nr:hypothetical protein [Bacteroidota bacterium]MDB4727328.1 hypothetical protein [Saprospiraceae bacterium]
MRNILFLFIFCGAFGCTKETITTNDNNNPTPDISEVPEITLIGVSQTTVVSGIDSLSFVINYTDGDGDLGTEDPDETSIEIIDQRDSETLIFNYHLQPLAPLGNEIAITGELNIVLDHTIVLDDSNDSETTTFTIRLKDRAGNWSNILETETITIMK